MPYKSDKLRTAPNPASGSRGHEKPSKATPFTLSALTAARNEAAKQLTSLGSDFKDLDLKQAIELLKQEIANTQATLEDAKSGSSGSSGSSGLLPAGSQHLQAVVNPTSALKAVPKTAADVHNEHLAKLVEEYYADRNAFSLKYDKSTLEKVLTAIQRIEKKAADEHLIGTAQDNLRFINARRGITINNN